MCEPYMCITGVLHIITGLSVTCAIHQQHMNYMCIRHVDTCGTFPSVGVGGFDISVYEYVMLTEHDLIHQLHGHV